MPAGLTAPKPPVVTSEEELHWLALRMIPGLGTRRANLLLRRFRTPQAIFRAVVDYLITKEKLPAREEMLNDLLSLMACHAAVRAGDRLTQEEIAALVAQRHRADNSHHCPHGRPTSLLFTVHDLERQFRRV